jgi:hypothetical protein
LNYEYLLLLRQVDVILAFQMPHMPLFFVAHVSRFDSDSRRLAGRLSAAVDGLLTGAFSPDISITIAPV